jgi:TPR repeat protein
MIYRNILSMTFIASMSFSAVADISITMKQIDESHVVRMYKLKNYVAAREMAIQCSDQSNNPNCQLQAAEFLLHGVGGNVDEVAAAKYLTTSAEHGSPAAQALLGNLYHNGIGVPKDTLTAVKWWESSATNCNTWAQNAVARIYYDGAIVPIDKAKALFWVSIAARYKFPNADRGVEVINGELTEAEKQRANELISDFLRSTECGKEKPIVTHEP